MDLPYKAIHVRQNDQQVRIDEMRDPAGEVSLSPTRISSTATVSFSLIMGRTPKRSEP